MAADLHIHVYEGLTEEDMRIFFSNTIGSKHCPFPFMPEISPEDERKVLAKIHKTPNIWIGEVSWLKAAMFEDGDSYVPDPVAKVSEIVGEDLPVIDDEFIKKIVEALGAENKTSYDTEKDEDSVRAFLEKHKGKKVFTISW
jgi:hypothetical protein